MKSTKKLNFHSIGTVEASGYRGYRLPQARIAPFATFQHFSGICKLA